MPIEGMKLLAFLWFCLSIQQIAAEPVVFSAADGVKVHAEYNSIQGQSRPLILLFHQAGSNRHEYDTIAPTLNRIGFDTLAVDQRSGGDAYGNRNQTAAGVKGSPSYLNAYKDLQAALGWASPRHPKIILWGSSYSSSLVFVLAGQNPEHVVGLLAFSPGEYFPEKSFVKNAASKLRLPVFVTSSSDPDEVAEAKSILSATMSPHKTQFVPKHGTHGSSTLRADRNAKGAAENWRAVEMFLDSVK